MTEDIFAGIGVFAVSFVLAVLIPLVLYRILLIKSVRRFVSSVAHIAYRKRRSSEMYESLARNGYIYGWSAKLLKRYKSKEEDDAQ